MKRTIGVSNIKTHRNFRPQKQQRTVPDEEKLYFSVKMDGSKEPKYYIWTVPSISPAIYIHCSLRKHVDPSPIDGHSVTTMALLLLQDKFTSTGDRPYALKALRDRVFFGIGQYYADSLPKMHSTRELFNDMTDEKFASLMGRVIEVTPITVKNQNLHSCETFLSTRRFISQYYSEPETSTSESETSFSESETSSSEDDYHFDNELKLDLALDTLDLIANTLGQLSGILQSRTRQMRSEIL